MSLRTLPLPNANDFNPFPIRQLTSQDHDHIEAVFDGLSDQDRYYRFFRPMPTYPASVRELLTGMDGIGHVAVGAFDGDTCVGVARFVRSSRHPGSAEVAVTVSATHRGYGIARRMVEALDELAAERGIEEFEILVHPSNRAAASLFRSMGFAMALEDGTVVGHRPIGAAKADADQLALAA
ncbi:MAG: GNAT family N-acetyltransferase [Actinomycetota bacterium]